MKIYFYDTDKEHQRAHGEKGLHHFVQTKAYFATYNVELMDIERHFRLINNNGMEDIESYFIPLPYYQTIYQYLQQNNNVSLQLIETLEKPEISLITPRPNEYFKSFYDKISIEKIISLVLHQEVRSKNDKEEAEIIAYTKDKQELLSFGTDFCQRLLKDCEMVQFIGLFDEIINGGTFHFHATAIEHFAIAGIKLILKKFKRDNHNILNNTVEYDYGLIQTITIIYNKRLVLIDYIDEQKSIIYISKAFYENDFKVSLTHSHLFINEISKIAKRNIMQLYSQRIEDLLHY